MKYTIVLNSVLLLCFCKQINAMKGPHTFLPPAIRIVEPAMTENSNQPSPKDIASNKWEKRKQARDRERTKERLQR